MRNPVEVGRFVLSPSVEMLSVREFPEAIRDRLGGNDDDYVISDRTARIGSQLVGRDAALFLRRFREPIRIVDAVFAHSTEHGLDPQALLAEVYPFIRTMCLGAILIAPEDTDQPAGPRLSRGDRARSLAASVLRESSRPWDLPRRRPPEQRHGCRWWDGATSGLWRRPPRGPSLRRRPMWPRPVQ